MERSKDLPLFGRSPREPPCSIPRPTAGAQNQQEKTHSHRSSEPGPSQISEHSHPTNHLSPGLTVKPGERGRHRKGQHWQMTAGAQDIADHQAQHSSHFLGHDSSQESTFHSHAETHIHTKPKQNFLEQHFPLLHAGHCILRSHQPVSFKRILLTGHEILLTGPNLKNTGSSRDIGSGVGLYGKVHLLL